MLRTAAWMIAAVMSVGSLASAATRQVVVEPFREADERQQQPDWINRAIHRAVSDDLASLASVEVVAATGQPAPGTPGTPGTSATPPATTPPAAPAPANGTPAAATGTATAPASGDAPLVVRGTIQRVGGEIRVTGSVVDSSNGRTVGGFKATGTQQELFAIEDSIARQLKQIVAPEEADRPQLQDPRPVAGARLPEQPIRGTYEGSDLQRALQDRDYLNREQRRRAQLPPEEPYYPPTYPAGYGHPGYGYPGYGYGYPGYGGWYGGGYWGGVVIVRPGGGGVRGPNPAIKQTQAVRNAAVYGRGSGQGNMVISPTSGQGPINPGK